MLENVSAEDILPTWRLIRRTCRLRPKCEADLPVKNFGDINESGKGKIKKIEWPDVRKRIEIDNVIISAEKLYHDIKIEPKHNLRQGLIETRDILEKKAKK